MTTPADYRLMVQVYRGSNIAATRYLDRPASSDDPAAHLALPVLAGDVVTCALLAWDPDAEQYLDPYITPSVYMDGVSQVVEWTHFGGGGGAT